MKGKEEPIILYNVRDTFVVHNGKEITKYIRNDQKKEKFHDTLINEQTISRKIMDNIKNNNILKIKDCYIKSKYGLPSKLDSNKKYYKQDITQILIKLYNLHNINISHGNVQLCNILANNNNDRQLVLIEYDLSKFCRFSRHNMNFVGAFMFVKDPFINDIVFLGISLLENILKKDILYQNNKWIFSLDIIKELNKITNTTEISTEQLGKLINEHWPKILYKEIDIIVNTIMTTKEIKDEQLRKMLIKMVKGEYDIIECLNCEYINYPKVNPLNKKIDIIHKNFIVIDTNNIQITSNEITLLFTKLKIIYDHEAKNIYSGYFKYLDYSVLLKTFNLILLYFSKYNITQSDNIILYGFAIFHICHRSDQTFTVLYNYCYNKEYIDKLTIKILNNLNHRIIFTNEIDLMDYWNLSNKKSTQRIINYRIKHPFNYNALDNVTKLFGVQK